MFFVQETDAAARWLTAYFSISILSRKSIRLHYPKNVSEYLGQSLDYVITVCGGAKENCPSFTGIVKTHRHIGFDDPDAFI